MDTRWSGEAKYQTLLAVSQAANSQRDLSSVLEAVAGALLGLVSVDGLGVFTYEGERARIRAVYYRPVPRRAGESQQAYLRRFSEAAGATEGTHPARVRDAIERDRRTLVLDDVQNNPRLEGTASQRAGVECVVVVPLAMGETFVAGLTFGRVTPSPFGWYRLQDRRPPAALEVSTVDRAVFYLRIFPGTEAEYDRRHAEIWPELVDEIRESGLRNFSGFRRGTDVWYYTEVAPGMTVEEAFAVHGPKPANQRWNHYFRDVIAQITDDAGGLIWYDKVFESDGPPLEGPFERGFFGLVIDPERAADYEALHANPWPDLMEAIEASGFRRYQGFRRGAHVVYYGEFYPDMATVFGRMGQTEVNGRWGQAFEGIITKITDEAGNLITADEIYHQD